MFYLLTIRCNINTFFSFDLFMVYIPECKLQLRTLNLGCSFITHREQCNNQRPRCDMYFKYHRMHIHNKMFSFYKR